MGPTSITQLRGLTVALLPSVVDDASTLSCLEGVKPVRCSALSEAATCATSMHPFEPCATVAGVRVWAFWTLHAGARVWAS